MRSRSLFEEYGAKRHGRDRRRPNLLQAPGQYVSAKHFEPAKGLLLRRDQFPVDIALW
jgi:hypothetical protein